MKIKKNDTVAVISGKDRGKKGRVLQVLPDSRRVLVEAVNYKTVHQRRSQANPKGGIAQVEGLLAIGKVKLVCPRCNKPSKVGYSFLADGTKQRTCRQCKEII